MRALLALCFVTLAALGCAPSEEDVKHDWQEFLDKHQACSQNSDCTLIHPGCPLGCIAAIRADKATEGERVAADLIDDYESAGRSCEYDCIAVCGAACEAERCVIAAGDAPTCPR